MSAATPGPPLLAVDDLSVSFATLRGRVTVVDSLSFAAAAGEVVGIVGESGSGKSVTSLALMRLLGEQGRIDSGTVRLGDTVLSTLTDRAMLALRGRELAMIFQEPMTSLNPVYPVGFQIAEVLIEHLRFSRRKAHRRAVELMDQVGIPDPQQRADDYPHQLSGGMRQRVMIAMSLACRPKLLIADEPTTALDVTIQAQILELLKELQRQHGTAVLFITHDMGVIAEMADRVLVMYAGQIVEQAPVQQLFARPLHPYTRLLLKSIPQVSRKRARLHAIAGTTPAPGRQPGGCRFHPRCPDAVGRCAEDAPTLRRHDAAKVRCWRAGEAGLPSQTLD